MKMTGVIFSNLYDASMGDLTKFRTLASLPFGGRYRLIDFTLSNMANSQISTVGIVTKYNYQSLMDHLGSCAEWDLNRKNGKVVILPPYATGINRVYQGKLEALYNAVDFLRHSSEEYVLMSDSNNLCNMDYRKVLDAHIESGAKVTVVANRQKAKTPDDTEELVLTADENNKVTDVAINSTYTHSNLLGMGIYVIEKQFLITVVEDAIAHGFYDFEKDFIQKCFMSGDITINVYEFTRHVLRNKDILSFFKNNLELLNEEVLDDLFDPSNPIYTKVHDEVATYYDERAIVNDCLIADGCRIEGTLENSIVSRKVVIEEGAVVKNSIIMQGTVVKKGANIEYCILDKDVEVSAGRTLIGADVAPIIIAKGSII